MNKHTQKENVDNLLRLRHSRHRQTPYNLKRVKAHAIKRELSTSVLDCIFEIWRISNDKNLKVDNHPICPFQLFHSLPIGIFVYLVKHLFV